MGVTDVTEPLSFQVLGPLAVHAGPRRVAIPGGRQRILLAALLVRFGEVVPVDELVDRIWDGAPPMHPRRALHVCLTRLRRATGAGPELLRTSDAGYGIEVDAQQLDLARFAALLARARRCAARGDAPAEYRALSEAVALWRGRALLDVPSDSLHRDVLPNLQEQWTWACERRGELGLALGAHAELIAQLRRLTGEFPFHERFWHQLMVALYRCGRRVEALLAFGELSAHLRDELGVDPGPQLRELYLAILRNEPAAPGIPAPRTAS